MKIDDTWILNRNVLFESVHGLLNSCEHQTPQEKDQGTLRNDLTLRILHYFDKTFLGKVQMSDKNSMQYMDLNTVN